ncbi:DUF2207 domain-containing protein [Bacillus kwashiorkori]|uniref:DUF2207 domain-containing protein n=1 Tax=Bacillus kwashiorkori TaxID=1522318 RepID=UPI0007810833|nr:DUF2207 domain-containing protein [Bacillus kwashiorkori]
MKYYKKAIFTLLLVCFIVMSYPMIYANAAIKEIDKLEIFAYVLPDGDLYVEELYSYNFIGKHDSISRIIELDKSTRVEFFEGYKVPNDVATWYELPEELESLTVTRDESTYNVLDSYQNERRKVFYRYRLDSVVRKYKDVGDLTWNFFSPLQMDDIKELTITIFLSEQEYFPPYTYGFIHDLTNGKMEVTSHSLYYYNKNIRGGSPIEFRLVFPADFLYDQKIDENEAMLETILAEEKIYKQRLSRHNAWLPIMDDFYMYFTVIVLLLTVFSIFYPPRLIRLFSSAERLNSVEQLDSLTLLAFRRKLKFHYQDIIAGLYSLVQKQYVRVEWIAAKEAYQQDERAPKMVPKLILVTPLETLKKHEQYLVEWLFTTENNEKVFVLDYLPVLTNYEKTNDWRNYDEHVRNRKLFRKKIKEWAKLVRTDEELNKWIRQTKFRQLLFYIVTPFWLLTTVVTAGVIGMADSFDLFTLLFFLVGTYLTLYFTKKNGPMMLALYFLFFGFSIGYIWNLNILMYELLALLLAIISLFVPKVYSTKLGAPMQKTINKWWKEVRSGKMQFHNFSGMERSFQHAIVLDFGPHFYSVYLKNLEEISEECLFLQHGEEIMGLFRYQASKINLTYATRPWRSSRAYQSSRDRVVEHF